MSGCTAYELLTHQLRCSFGSFVSVSSQVPRKYCITFVSFMLSSSSGSCTLVHKKMTAVCMSCHMHLNKYIVLLPSGEKIAFSSGSKLASGFTLNKCAVAGVVKTLKFYK